jgi:hypothetical protein
MGFGEIDEIFREENLVWRKISIINKYYLTVIHLCWVAVFFIASCQPPKNYSDSPVTPLVTESDTSTMTPTSIPIPTPMNSQTAVSGNEQSCPKRVEKEISLADIATGTIVSQETLIGLPIFIDLQSNQKYEAPTIPETVHSEKAVSPDRNLLATIDFSRENYDVIYLRIFNARGEVLKKTTFDIPNLHNVRWLDNQNLLLDTSVTPQDGSVLLFNPFTGRQVTISNEMPFFWETSELDPSVRWLVGYSPNLEWGVYRAADNSSSISVSSEYYFGPVVYDFSRRKPIWIPSDPIVPYLSPKWSPDGDRVVIDSNNQVYIVTREGNVTSLLDESNPNLVFGSLWSPDGNKIAFWNNDSLMVYNNLNSVLHDLCFTLDIAFPYAWSPDSRFILISAYTGENSTLIDIQENIIYSITAGLEIHYPEWMISMP